MYGSQTVTFRAVAGSESPLRTGVGKGWGSYMGNSSIGIRSIRNLIVLSRRGLLFPSSKMAISKAWSPGSGRR